MTIFLHTRLGKPFLRRDLAGSFLRLWETQLGTTALIHGGTRAVMDDADDARACSQVLGLESHAIFTSHKICLLLVSFQNLPM